MFNPFTYVPTMHPTMKTDICTATNHYAHGGEVHGLQQAAQKLRKFGEEGDTILAHINPEEAHFLHQHFGSDTNPHTGLPQFGLFRKLEKKLRKVTKTVLPMAGSVIGGMFGGPMGSLVGGAIGGGLSSKHHRLDHALGGSLVGLGHSIVSPMLGSAFNLNPESLMGKASMMNGPSWGEQLGFKSALPLSHSITKGAEKQAFNVGAKAFSSPFSGAGGLFADLGIKNAADAALFATMVGGTLGAKTKTPKEEKSLKDAMRESQEAFYNDPRNAYRAPERAYHKPYLPEDYNPPKYPEYDYNEAPVFKEFAKGGLVNGYVDGHSGGQTDDVPTTLPEGCYVMDATTVSLLGDGNSAHGAKKISQLEDKFLRSGITKDIHPSRNIKAKISDGEYVLSKQMVTKLGGGSNLKGSHILDNMRKNLRQQKGVKKFLPPKSKDIMHYMR